MGKRIKKGTRGEVTQYISRAKAVRKLQLSLPDFRRLCILKGIYPREPNDKKKVGGGSSANKTYYHTKDIQFLSHEPLIAKFREFKIFLRKLKKAVAKKEHKQEERLLAARPVLNIDHLIKERFPTFEDALRDVDDALCMVFLFAQMPQAHKVQNQTVAKCKTLSEEFLQYIVQTRSLDKVFLSIKGIYYRATIRGQPVTWLSPYKFSIRIPSDVDFRVMDTFLLFYTKLLGFINYSLYTSMNLAYPPKIDEIRAKNDAGLSALILENSAGALDTTGVSWVTAVTKSTVPASRMKGAALKTVLDTIEKTVGADDAEDDATAEGTEETAADTPMLDAFPAQMEGGEESVENIEAAKAGENERSNFTKMFEDQWFFLSREVPRYSLEFIILAFGGKVSWEGIGEDCMGGGPYAADDARITHHVVDRPKLAQTHLGRHYVQPQWVYDCVNTRKVLPTAAYTIGAVLPPHLSPFGEEGNDPSFIPPDPTIENVDEIEEDADDVDNDDESDGDAASDDDDSDAEEEAVHRAELQAEAKGTTVAETTVTPAKKKKSAKGKKTPQQKMDEEQKELALSMMSKKEARLYKQIMHGKKLKDEEKQKLARKRKAHAAETAAATLRKSKRNR